MPPDRSDVLQGALDLLVLRALSIEPMHGVLRRYRSATAVTNSCRACGLIVDIVPPFATFLLTI